MGLLIKYFVEDGTSLHHARLYLTVSEILEPTEMFDHAVSATVLTRGGQVDSNGKLVHEGISQYVKVIKGMQVALRNPKTIQEDQTLAVCVLMSVFEVSMNEVQVGNYQSLICSRLLQELEKAILILISPTWVVLAR